LDLRPHPEQLRNAHPFFKYWVPALSLPYLVTLKLLGGLGPEHFILAGLSVGLSVWSDSSRKLAKVGLPYLLYALVYDSMRWYEDSIRSSVIHVREPYDFDRRLFGIHGQTPNEWLQQHTSKVLDFFCGLAYTPFFFIGESILLSIYYFWTDDMQR